MSKRKKNLSEYCHGCLAKDRPLLPIDSLYHIFLKLIDGEIENFKAQVNIPIMCWECRAVLRNTYMFLQNVKKANESLNLKSRNIIKLESLSKLSTKLITYYDKQEIHSETNTDLKPNHTEEIELKEELSSNDEKYDEEYDIKEDTEEDVKREVDAPSIEERDHSKDRVKRKKLQSKFKVIYLNANDVDTRKTFKRVPIDDEERLCWMEKDKKARNYRSMAYKCELCITGYAKREYYEKHIAKFHLKSSGSFECDICKRRLKDKKQLVCHVREHYVKYVCSLCDFEDYRPWKVTGHFDEHRKAVVCLTCGLKFGKHHDFYEHYRRLHAKVICDYCGKKWNQKQRLIRHIKLRHSDHRCEHCGRSYMSLDALAHHTRLHHVVSRDEGCYCVECDVQFDNVTRYKIHLKYSVKHKNYTGVPCPVCHKVYRKKFAMTNHHRLVHLKKTPYFCEICSRYFLNSYRLRLHKERTHDKIPAPKDRMCPHCDRGFSTNRILSNHIRTHTGERPYVCDVCAAKFAQQTALKGHRRSVHKILK